MESNRSMLDKRPAGRWRKFLEALVALPGEWGRTPFPIWDKGSAKQYASNIRLNIQTSRPVRDPSGNFLEVPKDGVFEARFVFLGDTDEEKPYWSIFARWVPNSEEGK